MCKKTSDLAEDGFPYLLHIIHRRKAEDIVYHIVMTMTTKNTHKKTKTKTKKKTKTNPQTKTKMLSGTPQQVSSQCQRLLSPPARQWKLKFAIF